MKILELGEIFEFVCKWNSFSLFYLPLFQQYAKLITNFLSCSKQRLCLIKTKKIIKKKYNPKHLLDLSISEIDQRLGKNGIAEHKLSQNCVAKPQPGQNGVVKHQLMGQNGSIKHQPGQNGAIKYQLGQNGVAKHQPGQNGTSNHLGIPDFSNIKTKQESTVFCIRI